MSTINEKNYEGANVVIVGRTGGTVEVKRFDGGGAQAQLSIAVGKGYKDKKTEKWVDQGTDWYTLVATEDYANQNWPDISKGDQVRVDEARLEFKVYKKKDGEPGVEATLRYGTLTVTKANDQNRSGSSADSGVTPF